MKEEREEWAERLQELISNAVEKALQCHSLNSIIINHNNNERKRNYDKESEERRHLAAKIYALLVQWRSDFSFQWRAKVSQSAHIFEEAIDLEEAAAMEEYNNPFLLQSRLLLLLRHFEAGNGPYILHGINPNAFLLPPFSPSPSAAAKRVTIASLLALEMEQTQNTQLPVIFNKAFDCTAGKERNEAMLTTTAHYNKYGNGVEKGKSKLEDLQLPGLASKSPSTSNDFHSTGNEEREESNILRATVVLESEGSVLQGLLHSAEVSEVSHSGIENEGINGDTVSITRCNPSRVSLRSLMQEGEDKGQLELNESAPWESWEEPAEKLDPQCCVCMIGLKGAALVPCGHTFCRKCTRELWKCRGTCPLCNTLIKEVLDIY